MSLFVAARTAFVEFAGERVKIIKDSTIVRGGHTLLLSNGDLFKPLHVHYECERPKPPAPTPPPAKAVQAKAATAAAAAAESDKGE